MYDRIKANNLLSFVLHLYAAMKHKIPIIIKGMCFAKAICTILLFLVFNYTDLIMFVIMRPVHRSAFYGIVISPTVHYYQLLIVNIFYLF